MDLANPEWKGKLALAPTETDFQPIVTSIALAHGQAGGPAVAQGGGRQRRPSTSTPTTRPSPPTSTSGQAAIGLINHYYWFRLQKQLGGPSHMQLPDRLLRPP